MFCEMVGQGFESLIGRRTVPANGALAIPSSQLHLRWFVETEQRV